MDEVGMTGEWTTEHAAHVAFLESLLAKYIAHVFSEEGTDFIQFRTGDWTDEEWAELQRLRGE